MYIFGIPCVLKEYSFHTIKLIEIYSLNALYNPKNFRYYTLHHPMEVLKGL